MILNKYDRQAFVRAVMDDVPQVDYVTQMRELGTKTVIAALPPEVQAVYQKCPEYLDKSSVKMPGRHNSLYMTRPTYDVIEKQYPEVWAELVELDAKKCEQSAQRDALEAKLTAIIEQCRTLKQAKDRLPEFDKYLPADRGNAGTKNLPVANLVADLTEAGWPKSETKENQK